ncbi:hypothetical protein [Paenibacillus abyssi]|uniref:hypothetical protein n=1 Tax=Paenibacillus abyssi TaxID=1340531 RepID=UPI00166CDCD9|nr:hypothetical protein [Paenibacillus abyssi]
MRTFDHEDKIQLIGQVICSALALILFTAFYPFIKEHLPASMLKVLLPVGIFIFIFNILIMGLQVYRYRTSALFRLERTIRHCKRNNILFDEFQQATDGTITILHSGKNITEVKF